MAGGLVIVYIIWKMFTPAYRQPAATNVIGILFAGLVIGAIIVLLVWRLRSNSKQVVSESSHTVVESIRKVFKIVCAEGHFNELYNFEETKNLFGFIPSTKRALVIVEAKVLVGFDFEKCVWEVDETKHSIKLVSFPEPKILSIETDYKYYNFDEGLLNLVNRKDLTQIQANGKKQVENAALSSQLPRVAAEQMRTILLEVVASKQWQLENSHKITGAKKEEEKPAESPQLS